ncbi:dTDP-4-dehydrorhamnose reductase [Robertkochia marina]|uniref:dTDP-4-dehydrorhamnose reductase n=1 Tax=Robertkochia marina TaxID=1227945 RepID=A0A4S3M3R8_9FLAO|nr:dTDP-4-dehydrorhamnose reductase [Robertkochia marina]THD69339.1 dTDP-4-dehydrorhamnose reductase [Robertkochia marina]TRZ47400.1 dTDP-4-dehydrorhamnose reductase [Robertkochia marina]
MKSNKPTVLITGATGQLGQALKELLELKANYKVICTSSSNLDITVPGQIADAFKKYEPDFCINCAAYTNVRLAETEKDKAYKVNADAPGILARACEEYQTTLIHISTDYVFDGKKDAPYTILDAPRPLNVYGASKLEGEQNIEKHCSRYYIVRTSWLYNRNYGKNFYRTILENAKKGKPMNIITSQKGTPTDVHNLAAYICQLMEETPAYGIKHFSDEEVMNWYDFSVRILKENDLDISLLTPIETLKNDVVDRPLYSALTAEANEQE